MPRDEELIRQLEVRFRQLTLLLYDTSVPPQRVDEEILPWLDVDVRFTDPWQQGFGRESYRLGAAGFHCMFRFSFDILQCSVQLDEVHRRGRTLVDGVMKLRPVRWLPTYPLRTMLVYEFALAPRVTSEAEVRFLIRSHEELWSLADMLEALPVLGWLYGTLFRRGFTQGFLAASQLTCRLRRMLPGVPGRP
jgi:hypothetical protein